MDWKPRPPKRPLPKLPTSLAEAQAARWLYTCQQCGLSLSDLFILSLPDVKDVMEMHAFYADAAAHMDDDAKARKGESSFWSSL